MIDTTNSGIRRCGVTAAVRLSLLGPLLATWITLLSPSMSRCATPQEMWDLAGAPATQVGDDLGGVLFGEIVTVLGSDSGGLVVADNSTTEILRFDGDGRLVLRFGREGEGPGEMNGIMRVFPGEQTLLAYDRWARTHVFSAEGEYLRSIPMHTTGDGLRLIPWGFLADSSAIVSYTREVSRPPYPRQVVYTLARTGPNGLNTIGQLQSAVEVGPRALLHLGPQPSVAVLQNMVCAGPGIAAAVECFDLGGGPSIPVHLPPDGGAVTEDDEEAYFSSMRSMMSEQRWSRFRSSARLSPTLPSFGQLVAGVDDELWVGPLDPEFAARGIAWAPSRPTTWRVFRRGVLLGCVEVPAGFRLMSAGSDWVAGLMVGDFDVQSAALFRFDRRGPPAAASENSVCVPESAR